MDYSNQYLGHIKELLKRLEKEQMGVMQKGAAQMADAIKEGHSIFVFGASHAGILAQEQHIAFLNTAVLQGDASISF